MEDDARLLGVDRTYLWMVLKGRESNPDLLARYQALKALRVSTKTAVAGTVQAASTGHQEGVGRAA